MASIEVEALTFDVRPGGWCDTCGLPSLATYSALLYDPETLRVVGRMAEQTACTEPEHDSRSTTA